MHDPPGRCISGFWFYAAFDHPESRFHLHGEDSVIAGFAIVNLLCILPVVQVLVPSEYDLILLRVRTILVVGYKSFNVLNFRTPPVQQ
jgi:hypothetical protein